MIRNSKVQIFVTLLGLALFSACSSSGDKDAPEPASGNKNSKSAKAPADDDAGSKSEPKKEGKVTGNLKLVTTTLSNEVAIEGSLNISQLNEALMSIEELARKDSENVALLVTYMALLRLHGESNDLYRNVQRKAGTIGSKNPWYLLEASYGAIGRREYSLADYLLSKAEKNSGGNPVVKNAVTYATGLRYFKQGKRMQGIAEMRRAAAAQPPYSPALLTLGFIAIKAGDLAGSEQYFRKALSVAPNSVNARFGLAAALRARGKGEEAVPLLEGVYKSHSNDRRVAWNFALALAETPNKKGAMDVLNRLFSMPDAGRYPNIDEKANSLMTKLSSANPLGAPDGNPGTAGADAKGAPDKSANSAAPPAGSEESPVPKK